VSTAAAVMPATPESDGGEPSPAQVGAYVTQAITAKWGPQLPGPDPANVIEGFCQRLGATKAMMIAVEVFECHGGMWRGAPVTIRRFAESQDDFFAFPLLAGIA
jgi:hypothetical protein